MPPSKKQSGPSFPGVQKISGAVIFLGHAVIFFGQRAAGMNPPLLQHLDVQPMAACTRGGPQHLWLEPFERGDAHAQHALHELA
jgi:hypothetical protein